jgi:hypothetical protein
MRPNLLTELHYPPIFVYLWFRKCIIIIIIIIINNNAS